ncbi:MAG: hypothetical protein HY052_08060 [Proteobacteria bacterium]|nr:hypothetical protein [Pseudomonadota bacterium]
MGIPYESEITRAGIRPHLAHETHMPRVPSDTSPSSSALVRLAHQDTSSGLASVFGGTSGDGAPASQFLTTSALTPQYMGTAIDQMVAASLINGQHTHSVLRSLFGLVPSLIGR